MTPTATLTPPDNQTDLTQEQHDQFLREFAKFRTNRTVTHGGATEVTAPPIRRHDDVAVALALANAFSPVTKYLAEEKRKQLAKDARRKDLAGLVYEIIQDECYVGDEIESEYGDVTHAVFCAKPLDLLDRIESAIAEAEMKEEEILLAAIREKYGDDEDEQE